MTEVTADPIPIDLPRPRKAPAGTFTVRDIFRDRATLGKFTAVLGLHMGRDISGRFSRPDADGDLSRERSAARHVLRSSCCRASRRWLRRAVGRVRRRRRLQSHRPAEKPGSSMHAVRRRRMPVARAVPSRDRDAMVIISILIVKTHVHDDAGHRDRRLHGGKPARRRATASVPRCGHRAQCRAILVVGRRRVGVAARTDGRRRTSPRRPADPVLAARHHPSRTTAAAASTTPPRPRRAVPA